MGLLTEAFSPPSTAENGIHKRPNTMKETLHWPSILRKPSIGNLKVVFRRRFWDAVIFC